jgi:hypothetical protein
MSQKLNSDEVAQIVCDFYNDFTTKFIEQSREPFERSTHLASVSLNDMFRHWFSEIVETLPREDQDKILSNLNLKKALTEYY